ARYTLALAALAFAIPSSAYAADYPPKPAVGPTKPYTVPASESYQLPNGMRVTLVPFGQVPKAVVYLAVDSGSADEGANTGIASLTPKLLREAAGGRKGSALAAAAASMGGSLQVNASQLQT